MNKEEPKILYKITAYDSDYIKETPDKARTLGGVIYYYYDFKNHRYLSQYVSDDFNLYDELKNQQDKIQQLQNNWNELKEWLKTRINTDKDYERYSHVKEKLQVEDCVIKQVMFYMQELESRKQ